MWNWLIDYSYIYRSIIHCCKTFVIFYVSKNIKHLYHHLFLAHIKIPNQTDTSFDISPKDIRQFLSSFQIISNLPSFSRCQRCEISFRDWFILYSHIQLLKRNLPFISGGPLGESGVIEPAKLCCHRWNNRWKTGKREQYPSNSSNIGFLITHAKLNPNEERSLFTWARFFFRFPFCDGVDINTSRK